MTSFHRLPPIHSLTAFEAAARLGGFAQAAAELCITPSAVSHRIRLLEAQLGETLFERSPNGARLLPVGEHYLTAVREAFGKLSNFMADADPGPARVRVGVPPTFARNMLIPRLPSFYARWPEIEIEVCVSPPLEPSPERHDVDVRFGAPPFDDRPASLLFRDVLEVYAAPSLVDENRLAAVADLFRAPLLRSPLVPWQPWLAAAGLPAREPQGGMSFTDLGILLEAAASGLGLAVSPRRLASHWIANGSLTALFGIAVPSPANYYTMTAPSEQHRPEIAAFSEWLRAEFTAPARGAAPGAA